MRLEIGIGIALNSGLFPLDYNKLVGSKRSSHANLQILPVVEYGLAILLGGVEGRYYVGQQSVVHLSSGFVGLMRGTLISNPGRY